MASLFDIREKLVSVGNQLYERGLIAGTDGNISVRLDDNRILITPSGLPKSSLNLDGLTIIDQDGKHLQGPHSASSEYMMHTFVYRNRPDIKACVHSHPPYVTAFAVAGVQLAENILPEVVISIGNIPLTDYAPPGTDAVPKSLEPFIKDSNAFILRNHGLLTVGQSLDEAYHRNEVVEHYARIIHLARQLGSLDNIPSDDLHRLEKIRQKLDNSRNEDG